MAKLTKVYLVAASACLVVGLLISTGLINSAANPMGYVVLPTGAICLGLFLISYMLERESARFDEDQRARVADSQPAKPVRPASADSGCGCQVAANIQSSP